MKKASIITIAILTGIIIISCAISVLTLFSQSIRLDESQSLWDAAKPIGDLLRTTSLDVEAPLYLIILHFWIQVFGVNILYPRILSLFFFISSLPLLYLVYKESSNRKIALVSVAFFALSPFLLWYSSEARTYTLFILVTSVNHLYFLRMMRSQGKSGKLGYLVSVIVGLYTHYFFVFLAFTQCLYALLQLVIKVYKDKQFKKVSFLKLAWKHRHPFWEYVVMLVIAALCFFPWLVYVIILGFASNTQPLIPRPTSYSLFQSLVTFTFGFQPQGIQDLLISLWPLLVVSFFFVFTRRTRMFVSNMSYFIFITFMPITIMYLGSYIKPIFLSRYLIFVTPTLFFVIAWLLLSYSKKVSTFLICGFFVCTMTLLVYQNSSSDTPVKEDYRDVDRYLSTHAQPSDIIAVSAPFTIYPVEYGYTGYAGIVTIPEWDRYEEGSIPKFTLANLEKQIKKYKASYTHIYIVLSYNQGYQQTIVDYMDKYFAREELTKFSPGLEVREYRLRYE